MICAVHQMLFGCQIKNCKMVGACSTFGGEEGIKFGFWCKYEAKRSLGKSRCKWKNNTEVYPKEIR